MEIVTKFLSWVVSKLPPCPFEAFIDAVGSIQWLGWLNWFIPVGTFIAIGEAWLVAIGIYYIYSVILRWVRAIE